MDQIRFEQLLRDLASLSPSQRKDLQTHLLSPSLEVRDPVVDAIESRVGDHPVCPRCGSDFIGKWGHAGGLRRFRCGDCHRTFNALTGTPLAGLRKRERWESYASCVQNSRTVRASGKDCGVHRNTAFLWRHRFLAQVDLNRPDRLEGIVEADETFFLESRKGQKNLPRKARHRGGKALRPGRSREQVIVLVARDRAGLTTDRVLPSFDARTVESMLGPVVAEDAVLCTDGAKPYAAFANKAGLRHEVLNQSAGERTRGRTMHLQNVNGYHSRLKEWIRPFHGVSTRWLPNDLGWRRMLDRKGKALTPRMVLDGVLRPSTINV